MKKILTHLYNRIFNRNKSFIVWSAERQYMHVDTTVSFTYYIEYFPYRTNKYVLDCTPRVHSKNGSYAYWNYQEAYPKALKKLSEFQREELIDLIKLPSIEGVNIK